MFTELLKKEILKESGNYYNDNFDYTAFNPKLPFNEAFAFQLKRLLFNKVVISALLSNDLIYRKMFLGRLLKRGEFRRYLEPLEYFYTNLADEESKYLLLRLVTFRLLGYRKVRLPLSTPAYWQGIKDFKKAEIDDTFIDIKFSSRKLHLLDMNKFGFPFKVFTRPKPGYRTLILQHYAKKIGPENLGPEKDDVVIDFGGGSGDTAIFFSYLTGTGGKVYSFEFVPDNIYIFKKNLEINNIKNDRIEIVEYPVWSSSGKKIYYKGAGTKSHISFEKFEGYEEESSTISIDDFVERYNIQKLDFIKTDIEGTEPDALKGAIKTLVRFKPKLAISIYHNMDDFTGIIHQINELKLGYKFYLGHYTIYSGETVLYCKVAK